MSDLDLVTGRLAALIAGAAGVPLSPTQSLVGLVQPPLVLEHPGRPVPAERVRYAPKQKRFFKGGRSREAGDAVMYSFRVALNRRPPLEDTCAICCMFYLADRRPMDVDNLMKLVMDAATRAGVWRDDRQVVAQASFLELDPERPRTLIAIAPCLSSLSLAPLFSGDAAIRRREARRRLKGGRV